MTVAVIGLGRIGSHLARHLLNGGYETLVWNRSDGPVDLLVETGATRIAHRESILSVDVAISILFDDEAVRAVLLDPAVLRAAKPGMVHICMSTISPDLAAELQVAAKDHGFRYLSIPLFGRPERAAAAALNMVAGGPPDALAEVSPILALFGKVWPVGLEPGHANLAKIAGNFMISCAVEAMAEAATTLTRAGADQAAFLDMMANSLFAAPIYRTYGSSIAGSAPLPDLGTAILEKDVGLINAVAGTYGLILPFGAALGKQFQAARKMGVAAKDVSRAFPAILGKQE